MDDWLRSRDHYYSQWENCYVSMTGPSRNGTGKVYVVTVMIEEFNAQIVSGGQALWLALWTRGTSELLGFALPPLNTQ